MQLSIRNVSFQYEGSYEPVFENLNVNLDTRWRLGLVGRNGRGKTTLLKLMLGQYAHPGRIDLPMEAVYFPFHVEDETELTLFVMQRCAPTAEDWQLLREMNKLLLPEDVLYRPFETLSKGEQTKALLCALFAREDVYPLIDEPTNHLDAHGRALVADYLRQKDGFLLVSHDRAFLNRCIDHVLSLNKSDAWVMQGNYDTWQKRLDDHNAYEQERNAILRKDIARLEESARQAAQWSHAAEKGKFHVAPSQSAVVDRGYVGAKAAGMMKRSQNTLKRRERAIKEKNALLHNVEQVGELRLTPLPHPKKVLVNVCNARVVYDGRTVCEDISFEVRQGDRVALTGTNGCGKSSILKSLCGLSDCLQGQVSIASGLTLSYVPQDTAGIAGDMRDYIRRNALDETLFKAILRNMDFGREAFDRPLETLSQGQKKKILLCKSLCTPAHLYIWDEPLNYIDVLSRVQVEDLIRQYAPTLLLVEHDRTFLENVTTRPPVCLTRQAAMEP